MENVPYTSEQSESCQKDCDIFFGAIYLLDLCVWMGGWVIGNEILFYSIFLPTGYNHLEVKYGHTDKEKKTTTKVVCSFT